MRLDPITVSADRLCGVCASPIQFTSSECGFAKTPSQTSTPDDHSPLEPRLPIPNRTVKRWHADDSTELPCESRSLSGTQKANGPLRWAVCFLGFPMTYSRERKRARRATVQGNARSALAGTTIGPQTKTNSGPIAAKANASAASVKPRSGGRSQSRSLSGTRRMNKHRLSWTP